MTSPLRTSLWVWGCLVFFLLSRVPAMRCPFQLNVDEGQILAQAMRYETDLTPWRAVDGETGGPILSWVVLAAHKVGLPYTFCTLHVLAAFCLAVTLLSAFVAIEGLWGEAPALVALAAGTWWLGLVPDADFTHYSSELIPDLLIATGLVALLNARRSESGGGGFAALTGLLLGLVPWAKPQAVPIALVLGLAAVLMLGGDPARSPRQRGQAVGWLLAGALLPSGLLLAWIHGAGAWDQFWNSYIVANLARAGARPWAVHRANLGRLLFFQEGAPWFLDTALLLLGAACLAGRPGWRALSKGPALLAAALLAAALFAALRPLTQYSHYEQLCLLPLLLCAGGGAQLLLGRAATAPLPPNRVALAVLLLALIPLPVTYFFHNEGPRVVRETWNYKRSKAFEAQAFVDDSVRHFAIDPKSLAVWGWAPFLYVDLGLPPTTRDAGYTSLHDGNPSQAFMRAAFLRDLVASAPQVIVDTEDYIANGVRQTAPATFPAFAAFLAQHYQLIGRGTAGRGGSFTLLVDVYYRRPSP